MTKKSDAPAIRFKGFSDAWEQRKFSDITFPAGEKNKDNLPLESYSITNEHGFVPQDEKFENGGTMREADKRMYYIVSPNSFAYNPARINVGSIGYQNIGKNVIVSSLYEVFKTSEDVDDRLLWHWFKSPDFQKLIMQLQEGGVRLYFYYDKLCMGEVSLPLLEEQRKIGKLFDTLDNLITLHQRKYEKLTNVKKSMLEKMFPQNGSSFPEIRFKGFTDAWEQRKFSDITFPAGEKNKDNLPLESYSITNEHGFVPQDEKFENGGTMREADKRMYYIVSPNSFAYNPARINVGSIGYQNIGKNVIVSSLYEVFKTSEDVDDRLLWHWFKSPDFQKLIMQLQEGGVRLYFYYDKLCMGEVSLPLLEEQRKIGKLFDTLDNLITLHQRKLEKLQNIKKSMLEKMFV
ncbi:MAG: restriction endonuclease subunit S [Butyricicoccus sp.]